MIKPEELADEVMKGLTEYADLASDELKAAIADAAKEAKAELKDTSPKRTGKYAKSWTHKKVAETASTVDYTVYSPSRYRLTHLLEHGHALRGGGRARAFPHIGPAQENAEEKVIKRVEKALKG